MDADRTIGCIGLGLLGAALCDRLLTQRWPLRGFDRDAARNAAFARAGGVVEASATEVARCSTVLLSLPDSDCVDAVVREIDAQLRPGLALIDTTTGDPDRAARRGEELAARGVAYVDATVGGSSAQAREGEAILLCGGGSGAVAQCRPLLDSLSRQVFVVGPCGAGSRMKLVLNLVLGLNRAVLAEGLAFAAACGLDPAAALEVLQAGPAASTVMQTKGPKMLSGDFEPQARLRQHLKDVRLILDAGRRTGALLPLSELHARLLESLVEAGSGDLDNSAILQAFQTGGTGNAE